MMLLLRSLLAVTLSWGVYSVISRWTLFWIGIQYSGKELIIPQSIYLDS